MEIKGFTKKELGYGDNHETYSFLIEKEYTYGEKRGVIKGNRANNITVGLFQNQRHLKETNWYTFVTKKGQGATIKKEFETQKEAKRSIRR